MNIRQHVRGIRLLAETLDPEAAQRDRDEFDPTEKTHLERSGKEIWLVSREDEKIGSKGGQVVTAVPMVAARLLTERTHVEATPAEIAEYKAEMGRRRVANEAAERERKGAALPAEFLDLVTACKTISASVTGKRAK